MKENISVTQGANTSLLFSYWNMKSAVLMCVCASVCEELQVSKSDLILTCICYCVCGAGRAACQHISQLRRRAPASQRRSPGVL